MTEYSSKIWIEVEDNPEEPTRSFEQIQRVLYNLNAEDANPLSTDLATASDLDGKYVLQLVFLRMMMLKFRCVSLENLMQSVFNNNDASREPNAEVLGLMGINKKVINVVLQP